KINTKIMGDPMDDVDLGPMVNIYARTVLHQQVIESVNKGARLIDGGYIPDSEGAFYPLTLLTDIKPGMPAFDEELFGPVISIVEANDESHAIELANQTSFGLGGAVFTQNIKRGKEIAEKEIQTGACFVNDFVKSDPRLPFGGIKESGVGREMAQIGMTEFVNIKTVVIK
ncbi:MAG: aldehyde dehydrogenase family protein, partial [Candidatus Marinimicrobia bacterium]|nr:aldehyde dehydrogenase family protein [Candidatus Neomarinimicrobiota bacterium]